MAALSAWHEQHAPAATALAPVTALPAHVVLESYSVLTRLPGGLAVPSELAASVLARRFPDPPLQLDAADRVALPGRLAAAGVRAGAAYDGLVALEAATAGETLLSLDTRAQRTYRRLAVAFQLVGM